MRIDKDVNCAKVIVAVTCPVYGSYQDLAAIVECKAYSIYNVEATYAQASDYVRNLKIPAYFVTDGNLLDGYYYQYDLDQFIRMERIPTYEELCV